MASPEFNLAEIAGYAHHRVGNDFDRAVLYERVGELAALGFTGPAEVFEANLEELDPTDELLLVAPAHKSLFDLYQERGTRLDVVDRTILLENYRVFDQMVDELRATLGPEETWHEHPNHLATGGSAGVFSIGFEGRDYVVKIPRDDMEEEFLLGQRLEAGIAGADRTTFAQTVAVSLEKRAVVAERFKGKSFKDLSAEELDAISQEQLARFVNDVWDANRDGIFVDMDDLDNIVWGPELGLGTVDYTVPARGSLNQEEELMDLFIASDVPAPTSAEDVEQRYKPQLVARMDLLEKLEAVFSTSYGPEALAELNELLELRMQALLEAWRNPPGFPQ
jgi:hypothetical protein